MSQAKYLARMESGRSSAFYRRNLQYEWCDALEGERELSANERQKVSEITDGYSTGQLIEFYAIAGSFLMEGQLPPALTEYLDREETV